MGTTERMTVFEGGLLPVPELELPSDPIDECVEVWRVANIGDGILASPNGAEPKDYSGLTTAERISVIFLAGRERLVDTMPVSGLPRWLDGVVLSGNPEHQTLQEALQIQALGAELEATRQTGDTDAITNTERGIADRIQFSVGRLPYQEHIYAPEEVSATGQANCLGMSLLASGLMTAAGLRHLAVHGPGHSLLLLVTANGEVEWRDIRRPWLNEILTDEMISGSKPDEPLIADIATLSEKSFQGGVIVSIDAEKYREKFPWTLHSNQLPLITIFEPEEGLRLQTLSCVGNDLARRGQGQAAIEAYRQAICDNPDFPHIYGNMGAILNRSGRLNEAIIACRQALSINPSYTSARYWLGHTYYQQGRYEPAQEAFSQAVLHQPEFVEAQYGLGSTLHHLKRYEEAIAVYRSFVKLAQRQGYRPEKVERAQDHISALQAWLAGQTG